METVYGPIVINLDSRQDRLKITAGEFVSLSSNFQRLSASTGGATGCLDSHCRALENYLAADTHKPAVMICEDDVQFTVSRPIIDQHIREFMEHPTAKVACLGFNAKRYEPYSSLYNRARDIQTRVCYIVKHEFAAELNQLWRQIYTARLSGKPLKWYDDVYRALPITNKTSDNYRGDQSWKILQQDTVFLTPKTRLAIQRPSYSDIELRNVNYRI
uniref:Glycosyltransferase n=1 Tax=viral metagenome TaxID=1070528 RepID=A0A6C0DRA3_9ZZZZ